MTRTLPIAVTDGADRTLAQHHPYRWRLHRGGITNVWFYWDNEFDFSGGRLVLRGTNGSGKSRALEMLLPFVFDADRRRMDATGSGKVRIEDLMRTGDESTNRLGYLWIELIRHTGGEQPEYLTVGALVKYSRATSDAKVWYFITPERIGHGLRLQDDDRIPLSRDALAAVIGAERITDSPQTHRERVRTQVFQLSGDSGKERFAGLLQLLHTLRSPDVGNRIDEGKLPQILSDALPPLSDNALVAAGEQLDGLNETRDAQQRLEEAEEHVETFVTAYRRYATARIAESATTASDAARAATEAESDAHDKRATHLRLTEEHEVRAAKVETLEELDNHLDSTITGIKSSRSYQDIRDLDDREQRVMALANAADLALGQACAARQREHERVTEADSLAGDTVDAATDVGRAFIEVRQALVAAGVTATVPDTINAQRTVQPAITAMVREHRTQEPARVHRPVPAEVTAGQADMAVRQAGLVYTAVTQRATHAGTRLAEAERLDTERAQVEAAESKAAEAEQHALETAEDAQRAADERDEAARALARAWRAWITGPDTTTLLPDADWTGTAVAPLVADVEALVGEEGQPLTELDNAAGTVAVPAQQRHAEALAELATADRADQAARDELRAEHAKLLEQHDPEPEHPSWARPAGDNAAPLWRTVNFADHVDASERAGIEAALLAAGLLTADVTASGLTAEDGQTLLAATGPVAARPLSEALVVDAASPIPAERVAAVLARIGVGGGQHPTWVDTDGRWANGPLHGRHAGTTARHIGAEARAAARAARIAEIEMALADLAEAGRIRAGDRQAVQELRNRLAVHLRTSPRTQQLATARSLAAREVGQAAKAVARHHDLARTADRARREWSAAITDHRDKCHGFSLPATVEELRSTQRKCQDAAGQVRDAETKLDDLGKAARRHAAALAKVDGVVAERVKAEDDAETHWRRWHNEDAELAGIRTSIGAEADRIKRELREAEARWDGVKAELKEARRKADDAGNKASESKIESRQATETARTRLTELEQQAGSLATRLALPGVAAATVGELSAEMAYHQATPAEVEAMVRAVRKNLGRHGMDENGVMRAQQALEQKLSGTIDVFATIEHGIRIVELNDGSGHRPLMAAAADLTRRRAEGAAALSDRERRVFTDFVLGGVAEELRRRLDQADTLIKAMNTSLASIHTSHGIGVKLRWSLTADQDRRVARVRDLVHTADDVRPAEETVELTELLKSLVDEAFKHDQSAGYATHLTSALDYRTWHEVQVIITGPAPGQERKISRRAKLSQGETRFVSYVTLFAAVDAYLSGLPDTATALRMILLDDAFAKVDDRTIGELMGLLVRLDLDFAMTGHALWGCYPQVPALDCYEVRRREGTPAVTTHVHWDGHNRHLRAAR